jgi:hypothetical protein
MSQRILIVGASESGKSSLARRLTVDAGLPFLVYDPLESEWDGAQFITPDFELYKTELEKMKGFPHVAVVDEAGDVFSVAQRENHWLFTRGRHHAMLPIAIAQRMTMIAPNVRTNATDLYLFRSAKPECETLAVDYAEEGLLEGATLNQGEFLHSRWENGKKHLTKHKLW